MPRTAIPRVRIRTSNCRRCKGEAVAKINLYGSNHFSRGIYRYENIRLVKIHDVVSGYLSKRITEGDAEMKKRKSEREFLRQQLELLAKESKHALPANCELSKNSFAMAKISNELLRRKCLALMFAFVVYYFIERITIRRN